MADGREYAALPTRQKRWLGLVRILVFVVWAMGWGGAAFAEAPSVATWDLGRMQVDEVVRHVFSVSDENGDAWRIEEVGVSCDCSEVEGWTPDVPAGGTGEIALRYRPAGTGFVEEWVDVRGHDGQGQEVKRRYRLSGRVSPSWSMDPGLCPVEAVCEAILDNPLSVLVVDVRGEEAYRKGHVPGAMELPLFAVKGKSFLRDRTVVVMDEGWGRAAAEVRRLRTEEGMTQLWLWPGGLVAWRDMGGTVEGDGPFDADQLPPETVDPIAQMREWLVVDAGAPREGVAAALTMPPGTIRIPFQRGEEAAFQEALDRELEAVDALFVLIGTESGMEAADVATISSAMACGVFHLRGGWAEWRHWLEIMVKSQKGLESSIRESHRQAPCRTCLRAAQNLR